MRDGFQSLFLRESDDANNIQANENYTGGAKKFLLTPAAGHMYVLERLVVTVGDNDSDYNKYGNLTALVAGIRIVIESSTGEELLDLLGGLTIKKTEDWLTAGFEVEPLNDGTGATRVTQASKRFATRPVIRGRDGERLAFIVPAADFSTVEIHTCLAELEKRQFG